MVTTQEQIYKNNILNDVLSGYESTLKKISKLDPENEKAYKEKFIQLQDQKMVYDQDSYFSDVIKKALTKSFLIYLAVLTCTALLLGVTLSFFINRIYLSLFNKLEEEKERSRYLKEISKWQDVAKNLAHEVNKPLQPIRFWISHIKRLNSEAASLNEALSSIESEVNTVHQLMDNFKDFSILPKPQFEKKELNKFLDDFLQSYKNLWDNVTFNDLNHISETFVNIDTKLIRNVLVNIIDNASEANPETVISLILTRVSHSVHIELHNTGVNIPKDLQEKIFEINYSTKLNKKNMGLGLAIVKTTILEHFGDIKCLSNNDGVKFLIELPLYNEGR